MPITGGMVRAQVTRTYLLEPRRSTGNRLVSDIHRLVLRFQELAPKISGNPGRNSEFNGIHRSSSTSTGRPNSDVAPLQLRLQGLISTLLYVAQQPAAIVPLLAMLGRIHHGCMAKDGILRTIPPSSGPHLIQSYEAWKAWDFWRKTLES